MIFDLKIFHIKLFDHDASKVSNILPRSKCVNSYSIAMPVPNAKPQMYSIVLQKITF